MLVKDEYSSWGQEYFLPGMELVSGRNRLVNEIGIIRSFPLMRKVANRLDHPIDYYKVGNIKTTELYPGSDFRVELQKGKATGSYYIDFPKEGVYRISQIKEELTEAETKALDSSYSTGDLEFKIVVKSNSVYSSESYFFQFVSIDNLARNLQGSIGIDVENQESSILILSHSGTTPAKSIDFLNTLMETYIDWGVEQNNTIATNTIKFIDYQLREIADSLVLTEFRLEQFQKRNFKDRIFVEEDVNNLKRVFDLEELQTQRAVQKEYYAALMKTVKQKDFTAFPSAAVFGFQDPNIDRMISILMEAIAIEKERALALKSNSLLAERANDEVEARKKDLYEVAKSNLDQVTKLIDSLKIEIQREEEKVLKIPKEQREFLKLQRRNKILGDLYTFLLNKRSEASIAKASNVEKAQILDYASPFRVRFLGPKPASIFGFSIFFGILFPAFLILLIYVLNNKIVDQSELESFTSIPILGSIFLKKDLNNNIIVTDSLKSVMAEAFRSIRTKLNFMVPDKPSIKVLVTSSVSGEGKTFTSINLAAMYSASGKKTLLVGADLRRPKIYQDFGLKNEFGLSNLLIRKITLQDAIQVTKIPHLDLISAGPIPPNPAELIESEPMKELIQELESKYEVIIIDSPPLGLVTDALLLNQFVDATLYIVRHNYTKKTYLENINQLYEERSITNIGIVVNAVKPKSSIGKYGSYGYGYGYGYGYYSDEKG
tara:strand:- start:4277 stop:6430 length:2154 start_codon:yes stop_codon:yes gene_type:complete